MALILVESTRNNKKHSCQKIKKKTTHCKVRKVFGSALKNKYFLGTAHKSNYVKWIERGGVEILSQRYNGKLSEML